MDLHTAYNTIALADPWEPVEAAQTQAAMRVLFDAICTIAIKVVRAARPSFTSSLEDLAEDLAHEAFVNICRSISKGARKTARTPAQDDEHAKGKIGLTIRNLINDETRTRKRLRPTDPEHQGDGNPHKLEAAIGAARLNEGLVTVDPADHHPSARRLTAAEVEQAVQERERDARADLTALTASLERAGARTAESKTRRDVRQNTQQLTDVHLGLLKQTLTYDTLYATEGDPDDKKVRQRVQQQLSRYRMRLQAHVDVDLEEGQLSPEEHRRLSMLIKWFREKGAV